MLPRPRLRSGATIVEFAMVAPVFFILIFGIVEISRGFMVQTLLANAARIGCRTGILQGKASSDVTSAVANALNNLAIKGYTTTVQVNGNSGTDVSAATTGDQITVSVAVPVGNVSWMPGTGYLKGNLGATFVLLHE